MSLLTDHLCSVRRRVCRAEEASGRKASSVTLIAVSKGQSGADIREAVAAGQKVFGENRVQEAKAKFSSLRAECPDLVLHLIGPLQSNKAEDAVKCFDVIQTLDRPSLAEALRKAIKKTGHHPALYIEVNIGLEPQKSGVNPGDLGAFLKFCRDECGLAVAGLMCIPPQNQDPKPWFQEMKKLADRHQLPHLSIGMSADFEAAISCGATEVRVGSAIFGER